MTIHTETNLKIQFEKGQAITPIIVFDQVEMTSKQETFHKSTHQVEELLQFIIDWENSGCDVFV